MGSHIDVLGPVYFFVILQWVAALIRIYVRARLVKRTGWDDAAMFATLLFSSAFSILVIVLTYYTDLRYAFDIPPLRIFPAIRMVLAVLLLYIVASVFLKVALGLLLLRVLVRPWQKNTIYATMALSIVYGTFYFFYVMLECGAPSRFPNRILGGHCLTAAAIDGVSYTHAIINALADLVFLIMPVALIWKENMSRRSKISIGAILGVGSVGGICTVIRIGYINTLTRPTLTFFLTCHTIAVVSSAELALGVSCICFATYKPLVRKIWPSRNTHASSVEDDAVNTGAPPMYAMEQPLAAHVRQESGLSYHDDHEVEKGGSSRSTEQYELRGI